MKKDTNPVKKIREDRRDIFKSKKLSIEAEKVLLDRLRNAPWGVTFDQAIRKNDQLGVAIRTLAVHGWDKKELKQLYGVDNPRPHSDARPSNDIMDTNLNMALSWYIVDIDNVFGRRFIENKTKMDMLKELSQFSGIAPLDVNWKYEKKGQLKDIFQHALKDIGKEKSDYFVVNEDNTVDIFLDGQKVKSGVSTLYLIGLMTYLLDKVTGGQVRDKTGFWGYQQGLHMSDMFRSAEKEEEEEE